QRIHAAIVPHNERLAAETLVLALGASGSVRWCRTGRHCHGSREVQGGGCCLPGRSGCAVTPADTGCAEPICLQETIVGLIRVKEKPAQAGEGIQANGRRGRAGGWCWPTSTAKPFRRARAPHFS